jgi:DNA processing protein
MTRQEIWLRLSAVKKLQRARVREMVTQLLSLQRYDNRSLQQVGLDKDQCAAFLHADSQGLRQSLYWLEAENHHLLPLSDELFPALLTQIHSPPLFLFVEGQLSTLATPQIAMVGSRQCSDYGRQWGRGFSYALAQHGLTITSGLALGIDGACHLAALDAQGKTVGVLGCGLTSIHPKAHKRLAQRIIEQGGALVSELPVTAPALPAHFPRRNRIISGMSLGVVVVEAGMRSGSLITARYALEQNREVFVLPGPLGHPNHEGTHWLAKQGAALVTEPDDIVAQISQGLHWLPVSLNENNGHILNKEQKVPVTEIISSSDDELGLPFGDVLANVGYEVTSVDVVAERAGQPVPEVVTQLLDLELAGWIAAVPGGYVRIRRAGHVRRTNLFV